MQDRVIAIDGPAGSGKSTAARRLAEALGFTHLNTGAMYRAVAFLAQENGVELTDEARVADVAKAMRFEYRIVVAPASVPAGEHNAGVSSASPSPLTPLPRGGEGDQRAGMEAGTTGTQRFIVNDQDRTHELFTAALTGQLKPVVNNPAVRQVLVGKMREAARAFLATGARGIVMEGRDIGTVVFPDAPVKFYIHASLEARTERRARELLARKELIDIDGLRRQIQKRDEVDMGRAVGPLAKAADAIDVDTTNLDEEATLQHLLSEVRKRGLA
ncbi:MAG TPA: d(CMP) kinase [Planctomycetota bacterium]|jgi:cytidylate kinase